MKSTHFHFATKWTDLKKQCRLCNILIIRISINSSTVIFFMCRLVSYISIWSKWWKNLLDRQIVFQVYHEGHGSLLNIPLVKLGQNNYLSQFESHEFRTNTVIIFFQIAFILNLSTNFKKRTFVYKGLLSTFICFNILYKKPISYVETRNE